MLNNSQIKEFFKILAENISTPATELKYTNNFTLLVAVVLSAQATDKGVNKATESLFKLVSTPEDILALGEDKLITYIKSIGLYKTKAKNIMLLCERLISIYNSVVPSRFDDLLSLAGVGRKTANVILNIAFNQPTIPVDTHVFRLARRIGLSNGKNVDCVEEDLLKKTPKEYLHSAHHLLILHGRYTCKAKGYDCSECNVHRICEFKEKKFKHLEPK